MSKDLLRYTPRIDDELIEKGVMDLEEEMKQNINKTPEVSGRLKSIWRIKQISIQSKSRIYNHARSVTTYVAETLAETSKPKKKCPELRKGRESWT